MDIIIRKARPNETPILEVRAAMSAVKDGDTLPVGGIKSVDFEDGSRFTVKRTAGAYVVRRAGHMKEK